jgi:hypothetical protein
MIRLVGCLCIASTVAWADDSELKNPNVALELSLGISLGGAILPIATKHVTGGPAFAVTGLAAVAVGPTIGHFYAGDGWTGWTTTRAVSLGVAGAIGGAYLASGCNSAEGCEWTLVVVVPAAVFAVATVGEIATAPGAACAHNRAHAPAVTLVPERHGLGLAVSGAF